MQFATDSEKSDTVCACCKAVQRTTSRFHVLACSTWCNNHPTV